MCCHSQLRNLRNMVVAKVTETATLTLRSLIGLKPTYNGLA